jgi:GTPase SAR1 family protein
MRHDVRILLVGDGARVLASPAPADPHTDGVGKSTLITSLIKEAFVAHARPRPSLPSSAHPFQVQHVVPEVTIPPEVTPENVTTYVVDSGGRCCPPVPVPSPSPTQPAHRTDNTSNQKYERHTSYVSCTPSTTQTPLTAYPPFGSPISAS